MLECNESECRPYPGPTPPRPSPPIPNPPKPDEKQYQDAGTPYQKTGMPPRPRRPQDVFPGIKVLPRPQPDPAIGDDYNAWLQEYDQWRELRCSCGRGYFCRQHGSWISGNDVKSGRAADVNEQNTGSCPSSHYEDYSNTASDSGEGSPTK
ncbi:hypothetical protein F4777DRAFT_105042 [Nemania sp. FL0916]|nr:hypothetical protein F4777DRAFT_105042 [Nemania sp. FL0916]